MRDAVLHLGRMLGGREDMHVAAFARRGDGDLAFEIEVILPAAAEFTGQPMRRGLERGIDVAAVHLLHRRDVKLFRHRVLDRQHGRQHLVFDLHELGCRTRLIERRGRDRRDDLPFMLDEPGRQQRLVGADRRDVVLAGYVGCRDRGRLRPRLRARPKGRST